MPTVKSNRKMPKSKDSIQTKRTTKTSKNAEKKSDELEILQRTILHTIVLDQLREPTWAEKTHDFIWTREGLKKGEDLMDIIYIEEDISERKLKQLEKLAKGRELQRAPEELTIHFGISLKRTHHVADKWRLSLHLAHSSRYHFKIFNEWRLYSTVSFDTITEVLTKQNLSF